MRFSALSSEALIIERGDAAVLAAARADTALRCTLGAALFGVGLTPIAAVGAELATGEPVLQQFKDQPVLVVVAAALFAWASLVPVLLGKKSDSTTLGPFRPSAELLNGRAAMLGFASLLAVEGFKHTALF